MFARMTTVQIKDGKIDEAIKIYKESVAPAAKSQRGYIGAYLLVDRKTGKGISIALWESEEDLIAGEESGYLKEQLSKFKDYFATSPVREIYEVSLQA